MKTRSERSEEGPEPQTQGAVGGMVGASPAAETGMDEAQPEALRDTLGPFIRQMIRDEVQGFLQQQPPLPMHPAPQGVPEQDRVHRDLGNARPYRQVFEMHDGDSEGEYPLGRGAVPRRGVQDDYQFDQGDVPQLGQQELVNGQRVVHPHRQQGHGDDLFDKDIRYNQFQDDMPGNFRAMPLQARHHNLVIREDLGVKVRAFDPKETEWFSYRTHFLTIADQANWTERTRITRLMGALQGSMAGVTAGLQQPITFEALLARVDGVHGMANSKEDALLRLQGIKLEGEGVSLYAEKIRQLVARAYPNYTEEDRDEQALRVFLQGLPTHGDFRMKMRLMAFKTLREAVEYGARYEQVFRDERVGGSDARKQQVRGAAGERDDVMKTVEKLVTEMTKVQKSQMQQLEMMKKWPVPLVPNVGRGHGAPRFNQDGSPVGRGPGISGPGRQGPGGHGGMGHGAVDSRYPCNLCGEFGHWGNTCPRKTGGLGMDGNRQNGPTN